MLVVLAAVLGGLSPAASLAAFPGANGKLTFSSPRSGFPTDSNIFTMGADGSAQTAITSFDGDELYPVWSPDGGRIVFQQDPGLHPEIWTSLPDGSDLRQLTNNSADDVHPSWSPDGAKVVFASDLQTPDGNSSDLFVMNAADGTGLVNITNTPTVDEDYPAWSPSGTKIAFSRDGDIATVAPNGTGLVPLTATENIEFEPDWSPNSSQLVFRTGINTDDEIFKMNADGTGVTNLTNTGPSVEERPVWSPAGDRIAFVMGAFTAAEIWTMNPDGTGQVRLTNNAFLDAQPNWAPGLSGYPRPKGASPLRVSLVPGYKECGSDEGDAFHGPPLAYPSCASPRLTSAHVTVGSPDANGAAANSVGSVKLSAIAGDPATPADEADVAVAISITDVRRVSGLADYVGDLEARVSNRITDRDALPGPVAGGTMKDIQQSIEVPCATTTSTSIGSACATNTTLDAITPGVVRELKRSVWQLDRVRVFDGGADGDVSTGPDTLFAVQGIFVP